ncbi:DUF885 domain-containing protein [Niveispirillum cyanobacteriorum]|uniref:DUF885 domain-containing protein n=1 Tax=Niveispirillum cyanobacteriorum TaxID=1612173 RepID=A0A2K9NCB1_9PROT|nr:DUF885 domain-containing protein [Niveispirillum cyanobacteriorum]AUN30707.1 DUF885 domain-containing protein [Niveispirillum cyanobacteriorum]GGE52121.1 hypothetical protein GCM10011317_07960 [Niveispirillum cyanobacteriorum]
MPAVTRRTALSGLFALSATALALEGIMPRLALAGQDSPADKALNDFLEKCWQDELSRSPEQRTRMGLPGPHDSWTLADEAFRQLNLSITADQLKALRAFDLNALSPTARVSYKLFEGQLQRALDTYRWRHHGYAVSHLQGAHTDIPSFLIGYHAVSNPGDARDYVKRLEGIAAVIDIAAENMRREAKAGVLPPAFSFGRISEAARNVISGAPFEKGAKEDSPLLADLKEKVGKLTIPAGEKKALIAAGTKALIQGVKPAYERFLATVAELAAQQKDSNGVWALPQGADFYKAQIKLHTGLDMDADQIHALGLAETARLHGELREAMSKLGFKGSVQDFFNFVRTDPSVRFPDTDAGRQEYLATATRYIDDMAARLPEMFGTLPKAKVVVKPVEAYREKATPSAFYEPSSPDGTRPGVFYANLYDMSVQTRHDLEALCHHEGLPGHHMQIAIAQEVQGLPTFRKYAWDTAYGEGWAMYTERMAKDYGFYKEPLSEAGRIISELFRAGRLVLDTGIHHKRWTREQAVAWMDENTANPIADNRTEIDRYFVWPGQALGYKIGMNKILDLREKAKAELGPKFDIRGFHDAVLTNGAVTLPILEEVVQGWIDTRKAAA